MHERVRRADLLVGQVVGRVLGPEAERTGAVGDLDDDRVLVRLAGLVDDRLDDAVAVVEQPLLHPPQHAAATLEAERLPAGLGRAGALGDRRTSSALSTGRVRMTLPVAGFSTSMVAEAVGFSIVAISGRLEPRPLMASRSIRASCCGRSRPSRRKRLGDRVDDVHPVGDLAEHGVLAVQPRRWPPR